ncbi:hypothetical protein QBC39DRAFT_365361 [Podospora conica]|nr:hypothetical protein QBC39DRAFT_365361 [Schizothecium conicum]
MLYFGFLYFALGGIGDGMGLSPPTDARSEQESFLLSTTPSSVCREWHVETAGCWPSSADSTWEAATRGFPDRDQWAIGGAVGSFFSAVECCPPLPPHFRFHGSRVDKETCAFIVLMEGESVISPCRTPRSPDGRVATWFSRGMLVT